MKQIAKDVGVGIVVTIILSVINSVLKWVTNTANANMGQIGISIANAVFYRAAGRSYASILHYAVGVFAAALAVVFLIACFVLAIIVMNKTREYRKKIFKQQKKLSEDKSVIRKMRRRTWLPVIVMSFVAVSALLYTSTFVIKPFKLWENFELDLKVIAPYVEEGEIERLRSE